MPVRQIIFALCVSSVLLAQSPATPTGVSNQGSPPRAGAPQPAPQQGTGASDSDLAQIRNDLNIMEGLNNNMSSEIEFLHDQNLQILLRTNAQMWTIVIRDLRRQLDHEERRQTPQPEPSPQPSPR